MFLTFEPVHEGGRHMKVASVQSPVRQWTSLEKERRVGKPPTPQECNDVGEAARRQQEWTGQVETLTDRKRGGGCEGRTETSSVHLCCSASIPWRSLEAELLCCLISLGNSDASPQRRVTSGAVDPPPAAAEGKASKSVSDLRRWTWVGCCVWSYGGGDFWPQYW